MRSQAQEPVPRTPDSFTAATAAISAGDLSEAASQLKIMKANGLSPDQVTRWETLAARVAIRLGDRKWLEEVNKNGGLSTGADEIVTLSAMRLLLANRLDETRSTLAGIKQPYEMSEIPKRRYEELYLKLEQLEGNKDAEEKWAGRLVEFVSQWDSRTCQSCHANPKVHGKDVTQFDLANWWVGARYSQLIKESGNAPQIEAESRAALAKNPRDAAAIIRLGYALRAQSENEAAEQTLRQIDWSQWGDREFKSRFVWPNSPELYQDWKSKFRADCVTARPDASGSPVRAITARAP